MPEEIVETAGEAITETVTLASLWAWPLGLVGLAIFLGYVAHAAAWRVLGRMLKGSSWWRQALARSSSPVRLAIILLSMSLAISSSNLPAEFQDAVAHIISVLLIGLIGWTAILLTNLFTDRMTRRHRLDMEDNLRARKFVTQVRVLRRTANILIFIVATAFVLLTFDSVRKYGVSLFASAGVAGLAVGFAARPVLANLIAGIQIALTQPIRLEDVVIVEGEWGWIEEIGATYVVVRVWDWRRMVVPLSYFIEKPFQNWTRDGASIIGAVTWHVDYSVPVEKLRAKLIELVQASQRWDGQVVNMQMLDANDKTIVVRGLMSARNSMIAWELRCEIREKLIVWLQKEYPEALPRFRGELTRIDGQPETFPAV
ncbi:mechanosensitive ion channel domain-containing protein [Oricola sp.]|uniref:mechanosensitive ion channel family protein n=1 Tax=Oricola sp. TaxID=1979950 RepID=UPI0025F95D49|nr:mechanosensitive ion channel domain-containing protein [Oricola sp.]MCI5077838.1 mechanosensitive ion channel family protein [Oricola sp.]